MVDVELNHGRLTRVDYMRLHEHAKEELAKAARQLDDKDSQIEELQSSFDELFAAHEDALVTIKELRKGNRSSKKASKSLEVDLNEVLAAESVEEVEDSSDSSSDDADDSASEEDSTEEGS